MVLILDGNSEIGAHVRSSHKSGVCLHACAACSELPSNISTMARILQRNWQGLALHVLSYHLILVPCRDLQYTPRDEIFSFLSNNFWYGFKSIDISKFLIGRKRERKKVIPEGNKEKEKKSEIYRELKRDRKPVL